MFNVLFVFLVCDFFVLWLELQSYSILAVLCCCLICFGQCFGFDCFQQKDLMSCVLTLTCWVGVYVEWSSEMCWSSEVF